MGRHRGRAVYGATLEPRSRRLSRPSGRTGAMRPGTYYRPASHEPAVIPGYEALPGRGWQPPASRSDLGLVALRAPAGRAWGRRQRGRTGVVLAHAAYRGPRDIGLQGAGPGRAGLVAWQRSGWSGGGGEGARTPDLGIANAALSQLSYAPTRRSSIGTAPREQQSSGSRRRSSCAQPSSSPGRTSIRIRRASRSTSRTTSRIAGISTSRRPGRRTM